MGASALHRFVVCLYLVTIRLKHFHESPWAAESVALHKNRSAKMILSVLLAIVLLATTCEAFTTEESDLLKNMFSDLKTEIKDLKANMISGFENMHDFTNTRIEYLKSVSDSINIRDKS